MTDHIKIFRGGEQNSIVEFPGSCADLALAPEVVDFLDFHDYALSAIDEEESLTAEIRPQLYTNHIEELGKLFVKLVDSDKQVAVTDYCNDRPTGHSRDRSLGRLIAIN